MGLTIAADDDLGRRATASNRWIEAPGFDLAFFILSPVAGIVLLLAHPYAGPVLALAAATLIGGPHYLASYTFYFWEDAARDHRRQWAIHFLVPALIVLAVAAIALFRIPAVIMLVVYFWNAWHVARQSCGILSIYRIRAGCHDQIHKRIVNAAIISTSLCMALWNTEWYPALHQVLSLPYQEMPRLMWAASAVAAAASLLALAGSMAGRYRRGTAPSGAEIAFLATSLALFHPYLWVRDADLATLGMLLGHFIQYLGIVWLVNHRRFARAGAPARPAAFARVWRDRWLLGGVFLLGGSLFLLLQLQASAIAIALVLLHFYLDGVFWAFRRPEVRRVLGPYLTGWSGAKPPARPAGRHASP